MGSRRGPRQQSGWDTHTASETGVPQMGVNGNATYQLLQLLYDAKVPNKNSKNKTIHSCYFLRKASHLLNFKTVSTLKDGTGSCFPFLSSAGAASEVTSPRRKMSLSPDSGSWLSVAGTVIILICSDLWHTPGKPGPPSRKWRRVQWPCLCHSRLLVFL